MITPEHLRRLSTTILKHHKPAWHNSLKRFAVASTDLKRGVLCSLCSSAMEKRKYEHYWICTRCNHKDKFAAEKALQDYAMLIHNEISNRQAREFLNSQNRLMVKSLLQKIALGQKGNTLQLKYQLPYPKV